MSHDASHQLLAAGAALEDLEPAERLEHEANLATCDECRQASADLELVLVDLALVAPERVPPPDLMTSIRLAIAAEGLEREPVADNRVAGAGRAAVAAGSGRGPGVVIPFASLRAGRRSTYAALGLAAALAVATVGLGARSIGLSTELERSSAELAALQSEVSSQGAVMAVAIDPKHVTAALHAEPLAPAATAVVVFVPGTTEAYLVAHNLPPTPSGHAYQLWYADAAGVHPLKTVTWSGTGTFVAPFDVDLSHSAAVMVTLEPTGGATGEPGPQVVFGELSSGA
jgi:hypothetical protein